MRDKADPHVENKTCELFTSARRCFTYPSSAIKSPNSLLACSSEFLILGRSPLRLSSYWAPFNMVIMPGARLTNSSLVSAGVVMWFSKNSVAWRAQMIGSSSRWKSSLLKLAKATRVGQNTVNVELNINDISSLDNKACRKNLKQSLVSQEVENDVNSTKSLMNGG